MRYEMHGLSQLLVVVVCLIAAPSLLAQPFEEIAKLVASDAGSGDNAGCDVAIEGARIVVGAHDHFGPGGPNSGAAYIYEWIAGGEWVEVAELNPEDARPSDLFGRDVAMSGDTVVGGSIWDDNQSGSVSVFQRDWGGPGNWGEVKKIFEPDGPGVVFGAAPAIGGDTLLVGDEGDDDTGPLAGAVYVFERDAGGPDNWGPVQKLIASDKGAGQFGGAVAIDGETLVVGAKNAKNGFFGSGAAYVFEQNERGVWIEVAKLVPQDAEQQDAFGISVAIDGNTIVVGDREDDSPAFQSGSATVFERDQAGSWNHAAYLTASDAVGGEWFGVSVGVSGDRVVVGAELIADGSGAIYVYERDAGGAGMWGEVAKLVASDAERIDNLGTSVGISGGTIVGGAPFAGDELDRAGAAYVFQSTPALTVTGTCPGSLDVVLTGASPESPIALFWAEAEGVTVIPEGPCARLALDLDNARPLKASRIDATGDLSFSVTVSDVACGRWLQVLDGTTCEFSNLQQIP